jgi:hypothetical protein
MKGSVFFVLHLYENIKYINHMENETFGLLDISESMDEKGLRFSDWY